MVNQVKEGALPLGSKAHLVNSWKLTFAGITRNDLFGLKGLNVFLICLTAL